MFCKFLTQFSVDVWNCVPSLLFGLRLDWSRGNEGNGDLLQKDLCTHCCIQWPWPCSRPLSGHASARDPRTLTGKSGSVSCGDTVFVLAPGAHKVLFVPSKSLFPQFSGSSVIKSHWHPKSNSLGGGRGWFLSHLLDSHVGKPVVSPRTFLTVLEFFWYNCSVVCGT